MYDKSYKTDNPICTDANGKAVYQSGNDAMNPNGFKRYEIKGYEVWAYSYKDAQTKYRAGLVHRKLN